MEVLFIISIIIGIIIIIIELYYCGHKQHDCQLPDGVRTDGVITEAPQLPMGNMLQIMASVACYGKLFARAACYGLHVAIMASDACHVNMLWQHVANYGKLFGMRGKTCALKATD